VIRLASLLALLALVACPAASAHGAGGAASGYTSSILGIDPTVFGVAVEVKDGDDRLRLTNTSGKIVLVEGYEGEPYLRFADGAVYRNARSPATYLNDDRYARVELPAEADPGAAPRWERVADGNAWEWHDHRIHWMSPDAPPPAVRADPDRPHRVFAWTVPISVDGREAIVSGVLDYRPVEGGGASWVLLLVPLLALPVLVVLLVRTGALRRTPRR
jgi:hypothetical protein